MANDSFGTYRLPRGIKVEIPPAAKEQSVNIFPEGDLG